MNRTIATKMIVMSIELSTRGSIPGARRSDSMTRSSARAAIPTSCVAIGRILALQPRVDQEPRQQLRPHRERVQQHVLVRRVRPAPFDAEAVQHGDADGADEVAVGAAAGGLL